MYSKPLIITMALAFVWVLEGIVPHIKRGTGRTVHALPHLITALFNSFLTAFLLAGITKSVTSSVAAHSFGLVRILPGRPEFQWVAAFLLFDIYMYFWHIANHRILLFWLFHKAHHSDVAMDTTTALRFHPGELIFSTLVRLPFIVLSGISFAQFAVFETILGVSTLFHHSNVGLPERWDRILRSVIVTPDMHRVHHSIKQEELNSNFTSLLSLWDRLGRTFRIIEDTRAITFGLPFLREAKWQGLWGFLITPFVKNGK